MRRYARPIMLQPSILKYFSSICGQVRRVSPQRMPPRSSTNFSCGAEKTSSAITLHCAMASRHASSTARPISVVVRLAPVERSNKVTAVSEPTSRTFSSGTPISSAAICVSTVWLPWPISVLPLSTDTEPSAYTCTIASVTGCAPASLAEQHTERPCPGSERAIHPQHFGGLANIARNICVNGTHAGMNRLAALGQIFQPELHRIAARHFRQAHRSAIRRER